VLRIIIWLRSVAVRGDWRRLHNEQLRDVFYLPNIFGVIETRRTRFAGHKTRMGERRVACRILVQKPEGKRPLGNTKHSSGDNIKMDLKKQSERAWTGLICLRVGTSGELL
jgi:hypothetical protein